MMSMMSMIVDEVCECLTRFAMISMPTAERMCKHCAFGMRSCSWCPCESSRVLLMACVYKQSRIRAETCNSGNVAKGMCVRTAPPRLLSLSSSTPSTSSCSTVTSLMEFDG